MTFQLRFHVAVNNWYISHLFQNTAQEPISLTISMVIPNWEKMSCIPNI